MNYLQMNGYEFESFIKDILSSLGFRALQTSLSGDGGVDIVAYCDKPVVKGKYLVQCKKWENPVGQPQVRDLYGVVMSERANKGILITTSYFTEQAIEFANGLNIELIDGKQLAELMSSISFAQSDNNTRSNMVFYDAPEFKKERYEYLKAKADSAQDYNANEEYLSFLLTYVDPEHFSLLDKGLSDEILRTCESILNRFCQKGKNQKEKKENHLFIKAYVSFLIGNVAACIESMNEAGLFAFDSIVYRYVPCNLRLVNYAFSTIQEEDAVVFDRVIYGAKMLKSVITPQSHTAHAMMSNLFILSNHLDLSSFAKYIIAGLTKKPLSPDFGESVEELNYLASFSMDALNQPKEVAEGGYKWYPYRFGLKKGEEYSIELSCTTKDAISVQETLVDRWDNIDSIKESIDSIAHVLDFY